jgi:cobalt-zinc-cadmium efflux system protein
MSLNHSHIQRDRNLLISIFLNIGITSAQIVGGLISGSLSLLSDALHNFSDVISLIISFIASKLSRKKASFNKTFGYKRAEVLAAFVNAIALILVAFFLIIEAIDRFKNPEIISSKLVIYFSLIAILGNGFSVLLLKKDANYNLNMTAAYIHLFTDMMASIAVLLGGVLMYFYSIYWIDSILTLCIAIYLIWMGYDLLLKATRILMLFTPKTIDIKVIVNLVSHINYVRRLHHVHVWYLNEDELHLEGHLELNQNISVAQFDEVLIEIESLVKEKFNINHVTLQPEFNKTDPKDIIVQD